MAQFQFHFHVFVVNFEPVNFAGFIQKSNKDLGQVIDMRLVFLS